MYVVTFYSFKGGVGRTLALLNVAYELADSGFKVLVVDFDLEAPAIHAGQWKPKDGPLAETAAAGSRRGGIVECVGEYLSTMRVPEVANYIADATPEDCNGEIALMTSGLPDEGYGQRLNEIDWNILYSLRDGYVMFEDIRAQWKGLGFDYVLLDSRTGFTDVGGICTRHLPDAVVTMFRPDDQSLHGMQAVVESIRGERPTPRREDPVEIHFVMAAIPDADDEDGILEKRRGLFLQKLGIPPGRLLEIRHYQSMDLLTHPIYTDVRPRTALARSFRKLTTRIRSLNIGDRGGVLAYLRGEGASRLGPRRDDDFLDRIRRRYGNDTGILAGLAETRESRGDFSESAELLEQVAMLGSPTSAQRIRLARARHITGDREGALRALKSFFQSPPQGSDDNGRELVRLVVTALHLLEVLEEGRVSYVQGSPVVQGLATGDRVHATRRLDLSPGERRLAVAILLDALDSGEDSPGEREQWERDLAFARMAIGDFADARSFFDSSLARPMERRTPTAFNLAMAFWAETGAPNAAAFADVLEIYDSEDDKTWLDDSPNALQALAVAEWFGGRPGEASRHIEEAERAIHGRRYDVSCWTYTRVSADAFLVHCGEIRRLFAGEEVTPGFMESGCGR